VFEMTSVDWLSPSKLRTATNFSILIGYSGPEDKPFYRALLVSPSRSAQIRQDPFWHFAVISAAELEKFVVHLQQTHKLLPGPHPASAGSDYYVEIDVEGQKFHCSLGFDFKTEEFLQQLMGGLESKNHPAITSILDRARAALDSSNA
jgi:hypothetical protein